MPRSQPSGPAARRPARALVLAALLSGLAGLVHEVLWTRQLALLLGSTVTAISAVLASFMGGLGLGGALAGLAVDRLRPRTLVRGYAAIEVAVAAAAPALAPLAWMLAPAHASGRLLVAGALVLLPSALMGATLPVLAALRAPAPERVGGAAGALYAANTMGAVLGSLGSVLVLLPALGVFRSLLVGAAFNLMAGAIVVWSHRYPPGEGAARRAGAHPETRRGALRHEEGAPSSGPRDRAAPEPPGGVKAVPRLARKAAEAERAPAAVVLLVLALSGLAALGDEVAWTRVLVLLIGPTPYAFAFVLTSVIAGIALGSALAARVADGLRRPVMTLALVQLGACVGSLAVVHAVGDLPLAVAALVRDNVDRMARLMTLQFAGVLVLLLLPCLCFGATFPIGLRVLGRASSAGRALGIAYAWNTLGAIAGALLGGLVALPTLGMRGTLLAGAGISALAAALAGAWARGATRWAVPLAAALTAAAGPRLVHRWDRELLAGGPYKYAAYAQRERLETELRAGELVYYREGRAATISVKRLGGHLSLSVDGKVDATTSTDMLTQRMLAHLPLLLHGSARSVCVIGLGSGVTAGSALAHPVEAVEAIEISPEVAEASTLFRHVNRDLASDRRFSLTVADGRNRLLLFPRRYDVIVSEPSNPWMAGVASLFTRDFFALARSRLAPGGLMCQWAHAYNMRTEDLRTIVAGFTDVFPQAALFLVNEGDVLLLGAEGALPAPAGPALRRRMEAEPVREDLAAVGVRSPYGLASLYALGAPALAAWASGAQRHTDDRPRLEFSAPRWIHAQTSLANRQAIAEAARGARAPEPFASLLAAPEAPALAERAQMLERAGSAGWAREVYQQSLARDPRLWSALEGLVRTSLALGEDAQAERELRRLAEAPLAEPRVALALLLHNRQRPQEALGLLQQAASLEPHGTRSLLLAAEIQRGAGNLEAAAGLAARALQVAPGDAEAESLLAGVAYDSGRLEEALERAEAVLRRDPTQTDALETAAVARARKGDRVRARQAFEALLKLQPEGWAQLDNYAIFELEGGDARAAARLFQQAVELNPDNVQGWRGLAQCARTLGDSERLARAERELARLAAQP